MITFECIKLSEIATGAINYDILEKLYLVLSTTTNVDEGYNEILLKIFEFALIGSVDSAEAYANINALLPTLVDINTVCAPCTAWLVDTFLFFEDLSFIGQIFASASLAPEIVAFLETHFPAVLNFLELTSLQQSFSIELLRNLVQLLC